MRYCLWKRQHRLCVVYYNKTSTWKICLAEIVNFVRIFGNFINMLLSRQGSSSVVQDVDSENFTLNIVLCNMKSISPVGCSLFPHIIFPTNTWLDWRTASRGLLSLWARNYLLHRSSPWRSPTSVRGHVLRQTLHFSNGICAS